MNLYFFYKNNSTDSWYDCTIEAWEENDNTYTEGKKGSSFTQLEKLHIHISKHPTATEERKKFHSARFDHDFGCNSCMGHSAKSPKEFVRDLTERTYSALTETNYTTFNRLKNVMLKIYMKYPPVHYSERHLKEAPACRILC